MANIINISDNPQKKEIRKRITRLFQSGNLNFLLGSGSSAPAIPTAGQIEKEIAEKLDAGEIDGAEKLTYEFLKGIQRPANEWLNTVVPEAAGGSMPTPPSANQIKTEAYYKKFLENIQELLVERKSSLIPKQANIFTTNYDLFLERASEEFPAMIFSDGFVRTPNIKGRSEFSSKSFFNSVYNKGNLYTYRVEIPTVNIIKLHGSLSWKRDAEKIVFSCERKELKDNPTEAEMQSFNSTFSVILPRKEKFKETIMDRTYYDLLRIYANELDKENTLLLSFGFSFLDEHVRDITVRALKNPTLKLVALAYDQAATESLSAIFNGYSNVDIVCCAAPSKVDFDGLNALLSDILHPPKDEVEDV